MAYISQCSHVHSLIIHCVDSDIISSHAGRGMATPTGSFNQSIVDLYSA